MRKVIDAGKVCDCCGAVLIYPKEEEFCDYCKVKIPEGINYRGDVFWKDDDHSGPSLTFCSWDCVFSWLKNFPYNQEMVNFITLPYISDDNSRGDFRAELVKFMKNIKEVE